MLGDAKLVLQALLAAAAERDLEERTLLRASTERRIALANAAWLERWQSKLQSEEVPINPYRVIHEFMEAIDPDQAIVTHDSGSPRDQLVPFYQAGGPNTYLGWGKSHALGCGIGFIMGAKLAAPEKLCVHFQGDSAFGMTGLDLETAARCEIPILSVVLNNGTMAIETTTLVESHARYRTRDVGGDYAAIASALGVPARRVEHPAQLHEAFEWAKRTTAEGRPAVLEVLTSAEQEFSNRGRWRAQTASSGSS
jgi:acetolactate synthase-1/2/3 large subunit